MIPQAVNPDWSPNGQWISYRMGDRVYRIRSEGRDARAIASLPPGFATFYTRWSTDNRTVYVSGIAPDGRALIYAIPFEGGAAREVLHSDGPTCQNYRFSFDVHGSTVFLSLAQPESDVWMTELVLH